MSPDQQENVYVRGDDWCGLYVNGKLVTEGHELEIRDFAAFTSTPLTEVWADLSWLEREGGLTDVKREAGTA
jgi:hypothetical protein